MAIKIHVICTYITIHIYRWIEKWEREFYNETCVCNGCTCRRSHLYVQHRLLGSRDALREKKMIKIRVSRWEIYVKRRRLKREVIWLHCTLIKAYRNIKIVNSIAAGSSTSTTTILLLLIWWYAYKSINEVYLFSLSLSVSVFMLLFCNSWGIQKDVKNGHRNNATFSFYLIPILILSFFSYFLPFTYSFFVC